MTTLSKCLRRLRVRLKSDWREEDHPRAEDGRFGDKPGAHGGGRGGPKVSPHLVAAAQDAYGLSPEDATRVAENFAAWNDAISARGALPDDAVRSEVTQPEKLLPPQASARGLPAHQQKAIAYYTDQNYKGMNAHLRGHKKGGKRTVEAVDNLRTAFANAAPFEYPTVSWCGVALGDMKAKDRAAFLLRFEDALKSGELVEWQGFRSTSIDPAIARGFAGVLQPLVFEVVGRKALYVDPLSKNAGEKELLFDHGSRFRVVGIKEVDHEEGGKKFKVRTIQLDQSLAETAKAVRAMRRKQEGDDDGGLPDDEQRRRFAVEDPDEFRFVGGDKEEETPGREEKSLAPLLRRLRARLKAEDAAGHEHRPPGPGGGQFTGHGEGGDGGAGQAGGTEEDSGKEDMPMRKLSRGELAIVREAGLSGQEEYDAASGLLHEALRVGRADLKKPAILLWHGTSLENAKRVAANPKLRAGQRGLNASADISHAAQYPEDTGADALVLLRAKTDELDVDPNDQEGETVEEGLFPKSGYGSSCTLGGHQILAVIDMRSGVNRKEAFEALEGGDLYNALEHGATVLYFAEAEDES